ncbi:Lysocardiolipin acyltransferase 1 [Acipenser ruthenus]|uniref:Lysocardiolipin acyltransferase 1 n=1 Tax=Acipenser ruthenus TaxID=7906 RepID=A0A444UQ52_ACIRT|nr:Lysocardiolipin acyltransferase 1 [Acipenser ruthenus]
MIGLQYKGPVADICTDNRTVKLFDLPIPIKKPPKKDITVEGIPSHRIGYGDNLDAVHDITVAYPQNIPQTERYLVTGQFPREIHFHVQRYPVKALPEGTAELQDWCQERWREKEQRLRDFYTGGHCFDTSGRSRIPPCKSELRVMLIKMASLVYWTGFITLSFAALYYFSLLRYYLLLVTVFFVAQERVVGGLEVLELACHRLRNLPEKAAASETEKSK